MHFYQFNVLFSKKFWFLFTLSEFSPRLLLTISEPLAYCLRDVPRVDVLTIAAGVNA